MVILQPTSGKMFNIFRIESSHNLIIHVLNILIKIMDDRDSKGSIEIPLKVKFLTYILLNIMECLSTFFIWVTRLMHLNEFST